MIYEPGSATCNFGQIKFIKGPYFQYVQCKAPQLIQHDDPWEKHWFLWRKLVEGWGIIIAAVGSRMSSSTRQSSSQSSSQLTEIDSRMFGLEEVTFLSPNNTALLAHQGSTVTLSCRLTKSPNFGMVSNDSQWMMKFSWGLRRVRATSLLRQIAVFDG